MRGKIDSPVFLRFRIPGKTYLFSILLADFLEFYSETNQKPIRPKLDFGSPGFFILQMACNSAAKSAS
jgi:hypothetical protein